MSADWSAARAAYARDGFVRLPGALASADAVGAAFLAWVGARPDTNAYGVLRNDVWRQVPALRDAIPEAARFALAILDVDALVLFQDNVIYKPAGTRDRVEWHQDYAYWPLDRPAGVTLWIALADADVDNGCVHFLPGSHHHGERRATDFVRGTGQPGVPDLPPLDAPADDLAAPLRLRAGEVGAHHPLAWHFSPGNLSERPRPAWSLTFVTPDVRWEPAHAPHPHNWALGPAPGDPLDPAMFPRFVR